MSPTVQVKFVSESANEELQAQFDPEVLPPFAQTHARTDARTHTRTHARNPILLLWFIRAHNKHISECKANTGPATKLLAKCSKIEVQPLLDSANSRGIYW